MSRLKAPSRQACHFWQRNIRTESCREIAAFNSYRTGATMHLLLDPSSPLFPPHPTVHLRHPSRLPQLPDPLPGNLEQFRERYVRQAPIEILRPDLSVRFSIPGRSLSTETATRSSCSNLQFVCLNSPSYSANALYVAVLWPAVQHSQPTELATDHVNAFLMVSHFRLKSVRMSAMDVTTAATATTSKNSRVSLSKFCGKIMA